MAHLAGAAPPAETNAPPDEAWAIFPNVLSASDWHYSAGGAPCDRFAIGAAPPGRSLAALTGNADSSARVGAPRAIPLGDYGIRLK